MAVLEAAVCAAADQRAHEREEPAAGRRVQRRAARVHLRVHVGAVLRAGRRGSGPPPERMGAGPRGRGQHEGRGHKLGRGQTQGPSEKGGNWKQGWGNDIESVGDGLSSPGQSRGGGVREGKGSGVWARLQTESGRKDSAGTGPKPEDKGQ